MNPFLTVWFKPKSTTNYVIENKSVKYSIILFIISSYTSTLNGLQEAGYIEGMSLLLVTGLILISGPVFGFIGFYIGSWLFTLVGKWMNGTGTLEDMRKAIAVTAIPNVFILPVLIIYILIYGEMYFQAPAWNEFSSIPLGASLTLNVIMMTVGIWNIVITSKMIGVVHNFSSWRGFGVSLVIGVSLAILFIPIILVIVGVSLM
ncbi:YIP1 family protein [Jeotgalibacillus malaysiensis]|uniref:YIP1 family protein n=1 Tax=Jeotgalibacillus malaysiensis TaxID=1508404 RepID=UPI00384EDCC9